MILADFFRNFSLLISAKCFAAYFILNNSPFFLSPYIFSLMSAPIANKSNTNISLSSANAALIGVITCLPVIIFSLKEAQAAIKLKQIEKVFLAFVSFSKAAYNNGV